MHAAALQNCPRCQIRDKVAAPLTFKAFTLPEEFEAKQEEPSEPEPRHGEAAHATS